MSLLDSLLLDPVEMEVGVAPRTDGVLGSGSEDDPYDGSTIATPQQGVTIAAELDDDGKRTNVAIATATNHGYQSLQLVQISGAGQPDGIYYNGTFYITKIDDNTFKYTMWGIPGGAASGNITCQLDPYRFDDVMRSMPVTVYSLTAVNRTATADALHHGFPHGALVTIAGVTGSDAQYYNGTFVISVTGPHSFTYTIAHTVGSGAVGAITCRLSQFDAAARSVRAAPPVVVRLGPGTIETKGYAPKALAGWMPRSGMKILGSGMEATVLKLVGAVLDNNLNNSLAIGGPYDNPLDGFEALDFTADVNGAGQPSQLATCGAIGVSGTYIRLRRIRAINCIAQALPANAVGGFPLAVVGQQVFPDGTILEGVACWIEDCIVEQPGLNDVSNTQQIAIFGAEEVEPMTYHRGCVIRNCVVNRELRKNPAPVRAIAYVGMGGTFQVTTSLPHGLADGDWVRISGAVLDGTIYNSFNGSYQIVLQDDFHFVYYTDPAQPSTAVPTGDMWVNKFPSWPVEVSVISRDTPVPHPPPPAPPEDYTCTVTVTTASAHFLVPGQNVVINGVGPAAFGAVDSFDGAFAVQDVLSPTQFTYLFTTKSSPPTSPPPPNADGHPYLGVNVQGLSTGMGTASVYEGNRISNCVSGLYNDTNNTWDQVIRNNYLQGVALSSYQNLQVTSPSYGGIQLVSLTTDATGLATAVTPRAHGFRPGDSVIIFGVTGTGSEAYNKTQAIAWVTDATHFNFQVSLLNDSRTWARYATQVPDWQRLLGTASDPALRYQQVGGLYVVTGFVDVVRYPQGHGLALGEVVEISKASFDGGAHVFAGFFTVTWIEDASPSRKFQFQVPSGPGPLTDSSAGYYGRLWQGGRFVEENDIIEVAPVQTNGYSSAGIKLGYAKEGAPTRFVFPLAILRRNTVRHLDGMADPSLPPVSNKVLGIDAGSCAGLIAEENVIDVGEGGPIWAPVRYSACTTTEFFANTTSAGQLVQGRERGAGADTGEFWTRVEEAQGLAL